MNYQNVFNLYHKVSSILYDWRSTGEEGGCAAKALAALGPLRHSLSCYVCYGLLHRPMSCIGSDCQHYLCADCVWGKLRLPQGGRSSCSICKDRALFVEDDILSSLLECYAQLCRCLEDQLSHSQKAGTEQAMEIRRLAAEASHRTKNGITEDPPSSYKSFELLSEIHSSSSSGRTAHSGRTWTSVDEIGGCSGRTQTSSGTDELLDEICSRSGRTRTSSEVENSPQPPGKSEEWSRPSKRKRRHPTVPSRTTRSAPLLRARKMCQRMC